MNWAHAHLLLNQLPILGTAFGVLLVSVAVTRKSEGLKRASFAALIFTAAVALPVYFTGEPVEKDRQSFFTPSVAQGGQTMEFAIPRPLKIEHDELHAELAKATKAGGKVGEAATAVAKLLHHHFVKEEEYAMPPLGLLPLLAAGSVTPEMAKVLPMTDRMKAELPQMLAEHKAIVAALKTLAAAAQEEQQVEYVRFSEKLIVHAQTEEEVFYPAAIMVGEYLKLKLPK